MSSLANWDGRKTFHPATAANLKHRPSSSQSAPNGWHKGPPERARSPHTPVFLNFPSNETANIDTRSSFQNSTAPNARQRYPSSNADGNYAEGDYSSSQYEMLSVAAFKSPPRRTAPPDDTLNGRNKSGLYDATSTTSLTMATTHISDILPANMRNAVSEGSADAEGENEEDTQPVSDSNYPAVVGVNPIDTSPNHRSSPYDADQDSLFGASPPSTPDRHHPAVSVKLPTSIERGKEKQREKARDPRRQAPTRQNRVSFHEQPTKDPRFYVAVPPLPRGVCLSDYQPIIRAKRHPRRTPKSHVQDEGEENSLVAALRNASAANERTSKAYRQRDPAGDLGSAKRRGRPPKNKQREPDEDRARVLQTVWRPPPSILLPMPEVQQQDLVSNLGFLIAEIKPTPNDAGQTPAWDLTLAPFCDFVSQPDEYGEERSDILPGVFVDAEPEVSKKRNRQLSEAEIIVITSDEDEEELPRRKSLKRQRTETTSIEFVPPVLQAPIPALPKKRKVAPQLPTSSHQGQASPSESYSALFAPASKRPIVSYPDEMEWDSSETGFSPQSKKGKGKEKATEMNGDFSIDDPWFFSRPGNDVEGKGKAKQLPQPESYSHMSLVSTSPPNSSPHKTSPSGRNGGHGSSLFSSPSRTEVPPTPPHHTSASSHHAARKPTSPPKLTGSPKGGAKTVKKPVGSRSPEKAQFWQSGHRVSSPTSKVLSRLKFSKKSTTTSPAPAPLPGSHQRELSPRFHQPKQTLPPFVDQGKLSPPQPMNDHDMFIAAASYKPSSEEHLAVHNGTVAPSDIFGPSPEESLPRPESPMRISTPLSEPVESAPRRHSPSPSMYSSEDDTASNASLFGEDSSSLAGPSRPRRQSAAQRKWQLSDLNSGSDSSRVRVVQRSFKRATQRVLSSSDDSQEDIPVESSAKWKGKQKRASPSIMHKTSGSSDHERAGPSSVNKKRQPGTKAHQAVVAPFVFGSGILPPEIFAKGFKWPSGNPNRIYCHQCRTKAPIITMICSCKAPYCCRCLVVRYNNRYQIDEAAQDFMCPRCFEECNCDKCCLKRGEIYVRMQRTPKQVNTRIISPSRPRRTKAKPQAPPPDSDSESPPLVVRPHGMRELSPSNPQLWSMAVYDVTGKHYCGSAWTDAIGIDMYPPDVVVMNAVEVPNRHQSPPARAIEVDQGEEEIMAELQDPAPVKRRRAIRKPIKRLFVGNAHSSWQVFVGKDPVIRDISDPLGKGKGNFIPADDVFVPQARIGPDIRGRRIYVGEQKALFLKQKQRGVHDDADDGDDEDDGEHEDDEGGEHEDDEDKDKQEGLGAEEISEVDPRHLQPITTNLPRLPHSLDEAMESPLTDLSADAENAQTSFSSLSEEQMRLVFDSVHKAMSEPPEEVSV